MALTEELCSVVKCDKCVTVPSINTNKNVASEGKLVILYGGYEMVLQIVLKHQSIVNCRLGNFHHCDIIGLPFGSKVYDRKTKKWIAVLKPNSDLLNLSLTHRTQVLYHTDIAIITMFLDVLPGKKIIEAGTGSGALSTAIASVLKPNGCLYTFEYHKERQLASVEQFVLYGMEDVVKSSHRDVVVDGFPDDLHYDDTSTSQLGVDGVFLDLPNPFEAIRHATKCLKPNGKLVSFSPCLEQVQGSCTVLASCGFKEMRTVECLCKPWGVSVAEKKCSGEKANTNTTSKLQKVNQEGTASFDLMVNSCKRVKASQENNSPAIRPPITKTPTSLSGDVVEYTKKKMVSNHYQLPMRGHTGYLTFAVNSPTFMKVDDNIVKQEKPL